MKRYKSVFPISLGCGYRLNVIGDDLIIEERGILRFWKWTVIVKESLSKLKNGKDLREIAAGKV